MMMMLWCIFFFFLRKYYRCKGGRYWMIKMMEVTFHIYETKEIIINEELSKIYELKSSFLVEYFYEI